MKTYGINNESGKLFAFEVGNVFLGRRGACRVVRSIPGVRIHRLPKGWPHSNEDIFCEFELGGQHFEIYEPFGDNSRYWVGPKSAKDTEEILVIRAAFEQAGFLGFRRQKRKSQM